MNRPEDCSDDTINLLIDDPALVFARRTQKAGQEVLNTLHDMRRELTDHGMTEQAEALWMDALRMHQKYRADREEANAPDELPAVLRPQAGAR